MKFILLFLLFQISTSYAQDTNNYVARLNFKLLDLGKIDNENFLEGSVKDILNAEGLKVAEEVMRESQLNFDLRNLHFRKLFPDYKTSDSVSIGRQGSTVTVPPFWATLSITKPPKIESHQFMEQMKKLYPLIIYIDPPLIVKFWNLPNDSLFTEQLSLYNFENQGADINIDSAWNIETGKRFIKIGVFDSGIDSTHPDIDVLGGIPITTIWRWMKTTM